MSSSSQHSYTGCYFIACFSDTSAVVPREVHLPKPVIYVNLNTNLSRPSVLEQELENMGNATYESYPALNNFVFLCKECRVCWMFHWAPAVNLHTVENLKNCLIWEQIIVLILWAPSPWFHWSFWWSWRQVWRGRSHQDCHRHWTQGCRSCCLRQSVGAGKKWLVLQNYWFTNWSFTCHKRALRRVSMV